MENVIKRWGKISKKSKKHYMFLGASLYRYVPIVVIALLAMELINKYRYINISFLVANFIIKVVIAYIIGVYIGYLKWNIFEKTIGNKFLTNKSFRLSYIYTYGVCFFGTSFALAKINLFFMTTRANVITGITCLMSGFLWGFIMSFTINFDSMK